MVDIDGFTLICMMAVVGVIVYSAIQIVHHFYVTWKRR